MYMEIPPGFESEDNTRKVFKLQKSLYGLKQSLRAWFDRFTKAVKKYDFLSNNQITLCQTFT